MKRFTGFSVIVSIIIILSLVSSLKVKAQGGGTDWSQPFRLSSQNGQVGDQIMFADIFGYVHLFWPETGNLENQPILYYSRFDGETWTLPVDIYIAPASTSISATFDIKGNLHLLFTDGGNGNVYYTKASIQDATSAQGWQSPRRLEFTAKSISFRIDSGGVFHLLYSGFNRNEPGMYYTNSLDEGQTWSRSIWLDPDIPPNLSPWEIQLELGDENSLHATWLYWDQDFLGRWIRYANSFDQGQSWSTPYTIDEVEAGSDDLRLPWPIMALNGQEVHIIWAGDSQTHRKHRFSSDLGRTWNQSRFVFGDLHGAALGHGLALDANGRLHFFGQIRWPQGIWQAYWEQGRWSSPTMIYLIAQDAFEPLEGRIHAHRVRVAIRSGNQLMVTFTTSPGDPQSILYEMHMNMQDVQALDTLSLPEQFPEPTSDSGSVLNSPTLLPEIPTEEMPNLDTTLDPNPSISMSPAVELIWGIVPAIVLLVGVLAFRFLNRRNN